MGNGFSSDPHKYKCNAYVNPLNVHRAEQRECGFLTFTPALSADGRMVEMRLDTSLPDGNPFHRVRDMLQKDKYMAIIDAAHVVVRKNGTGVAMDIELTEIFSLPKGSRLETGVPDQSGVMALDEGIPDANEMVELFNKITFGVAARDEAVSMTGDKVYTARAELMAHQDWAGMDRAFHPPAQRKAAPPTEGFVEEAVGEGAGDDDDDEDADLNAPPPEVDKYEFFKDTHPMIRALRMYQEDLQVARGDWELVRDPSGKHISHKLSKALAGRIRSKMNNTYLRWRRYTQFIRTTARVVTNPTVQSQLNTEFLEKLKDPTWPRPALTCLVVLKLIYFGQGAPEQEFKIFQLE